MSVEAILLINVIYENKAKQIVETILIAAFTIIFWGVFLICTPYITHETAQEIVVNMEKDLIVVKQQDLEDIHHSEIGFSTQPSDNAYNIFLKKDYVIYGYNKIENKLYYYIVNPISGKIIKVTPPPK